jgi:hypothetical protein
MSDIGTATLKESVIYLIWEIERAQECAEDWAKESPGEYVEALAELAKVRAALAAARGDSDD